MHVHKHSCPPNASLQELNVVCCRWKKRKENKTIKLITAAIKVKLFCSCLQLWMEEGVVFTPQSGRVRHQTGCRGHEQWQGRRNDLRFLFQVTNDVGTLCTWLITILLNYRRPAVNFLNIVSLHHAVVLMTEIFRVVQSTAREWGPALVSGGRLTKHQPRPPCGPGWWRGDQQQDSGAVTNHIPEKCN